LRMLWRAEPQGDLGGLRPPTSRAAPVSIDGAPGTARHTGPGVVVKSPRRGRVLPSSSAEQRVE